MFEPNSDCLINRLDDHQVNNMQVNSQILINDRTNDEKDEALMSNFTIPTYVHVSEQMGLADCLKTRIDVFVTNELPKFGIY